MGSNPVLAPIGTSFEHKAPRVEAFFVEKLVFLPEPLCSPPLQELGLGLATRNMGIGVARVRARGYEAAPLAAPLRRNPQHDAGQEVHELRQLALETINLAACTVNRWESWRRESGLYLPEARVRESSLLHLLKRQRQNIRPLLSNSSLWRRVDSAL